MSALPPPRGDDKLEPLVLLVCVLVIFGYIALSALRPLA